MDTILTDIAPITLFLAAFFAALAGFIKGAVGFAMPMIMISSLASIMPADLALAGLILPTLVTNGWQAMRGGIGPTLVAVKEHRRFLVIALICVGLSSQVVPFIDANALLLILGVIICSLAIVQLSGLRLRVSAAARRSVELVAALAAGLVGGLSGVWGPQTVLYLTALDTPKETQVRLQGFFFGAGAVVLFFAHLKSGLLNASTLPFSAGLAIPALLGMGLGFLIMDRLDQAVFRKATLIVLIVAGLNLVRRGLLG